MPPARFEGLREREREWQREQRERKQREQERLLRQTQLRQQLEAPPGACPGGLSLNLSSLNECHSRVFIATERQKFTCHSSVFLLVLAALALELVGWFLFLGLLVTILAYLLLIIAPAATTLYAQRSGLRRDATFSVFMPHLAVHRVVSFVARCPLRPRLSAKLFQRV
ncbi:hypothetical protein DFH09DRAFT_1146392 [Mycena vulgaris]|nr:hypothetical protein DFH09DRAFT_1146392 [Mycena vulgaris]